MSIASELNTEDEQDFDETLFADPAFDKSTVKAKASAAARQLELRRKIEATQEARRFREEFELF